MQGWVKGKPVRFIHGHNFRRLAIERFKEKTRLVENGCHEWIGAKDGKGYGLLGVDRKVVRAHRFIYRIVHGTIESNLTIDHLCRNRSCVNPEHLEAVTMRINILRGNGMGARWSKRSSCDFGHLFTGENLIVRKDGGRRCRKCLSLRNKKLYLRKYERRF